VLLLATVALTGCRFAEHGRRAAIDAFASFVLDSVFQAPLTQPAPKVARVGQALLPVLRVPPPEDRHECLSYTESLPPPQPRIASIDLAPAVPAMLLCRVKRVEVRMALAELRGRRIVVIARPDPATL
jgi:hypothetical protein